MRLHSARYAILLLALGAAALAAHAEPLLVVRGVPPDGLVVAPINPRVAGITRTDRAHNVTARDEAGRGVPAQYVPALAPGEPGTIVLRLSTGREARITFSLREAPIKSLGGPLRVEGKGFALLFDPERMAGLPSRIEIGSSAPAENFVWNDRVHSGSVGGYLLRLDREARHEIVSEGPLCTVVRIRARYVRGENEAPKSRPAAAYHWYIFRDAPLVRVEAHISQVSGFPWDELHFLEMNLADARFTRWAVGDPPGSGELSANKQTRLGAQWGLLSDGRSGIGMVHAPTRIYDGRGDYGTYLHGPWESWSTLTRRYAAWLWVGEAQDPVQAMQSVASTRSREPTVMVTTSELDRKIAALRRLGAKDPLARWRAGIAERMLAAGRTGELNTLLGGQAPAGWLLRQAGALGLAVSSTAKGIRLESLHDMRQGTELLAADAPPLFSLRIRDLRSKAERAVDSASGWSSVGVRTRANDVVMEWAAAAPSELAGLRVTAVARPSTREHAWSWTLRVAVPNHLSVLSAAFPQIGLAEPRQGGSVLYPNGPGVLYPAAWSQPLNQRSLYPNGWCTMQFMAAYGTGSGLYFGLHDRNGGAKEIVCESHPSSRTVHLAYDVPAPNRTRGGNGFASPGQAVMRVLRGDWFDAARIYRDWAQREARWWPRLGREGREDTPAWMRDLSAWAQTGGAPAECVEPVKQMQRALGVPIGFHWYNWHQIPFDNDYPHYFPTKPGVAEAVRDLQANHVYVMPYINGRLWDTRDRGAEDWQFTARALPSATKQEDGTPFTESYGSRESDDTPVKLAPMCPTTPLWQKTVRDLTLRILTEVGTQGVYIDQVAAAAPVLCMDATHGHPLGGGDWWNTAGYWPMLERLRKAMAPGKMITTECNADPYIRFFDGYLTWHWQAENMVPAFPAVYAGAVQMFGRNYGAGASTRDLALCTKMGQQLVFGEQIGWLSPSIAAEPVAGRFLRLTVRMRDRFRRYFSAGEMARPPALLGEMPRVRSDWAWFGETWITTDAVLTGAWRLPSERSAVLLYVNVSDQPVAVRTRVRPADLGAPARGVRWSRLTDPDGEAQPSEAPAAFTVGPREILAFEARW
jgi:hypothetical protein